MPNDENSKKYNLEERTFQFAKDCRMLVKQLPKTTGNFEDSKQLVRSSGSMHANYIEANESGKFNLTLIRLEGNEIRGVVVGSYKERVEYLLFKFNFTEPF